MENDKFKVILTGIIFDPKTRKLLIARRKKDPYVPALTWCFPGGKLTKGEDLEKALKAKLKEKTGLDIANLGSIFSAIPKEKDDFLLMYFLTEILGGKEKPGDDLVELKWVSPKEVEKYFTTSMHPVLKNYILGLEKQDF